VMCKRRQISHFLTPPSVKIRGGVGDISIPIVVEALPMTEPPKYIRWPSTGRLLSAVDRYKRKKRKQEGSCVQLKAFPTNVGRPK